ncbi:hypothetical protein AALO_G00084430 [Alosa alosa]|uniref:Uncharacterized protein n=1 Tax=Alosa alosa TaxID=278164 RepID=A0AAV6H2S8_9TELE|nr:hypothetical protein AALO_G00084430 [Alosa alosa]
MGNTSITEGRTALNLGTTSIKRDKTKIQMGSSSISRGKSTTSLGTSTITSGKTKISMGRLNCQRPGLFSFQIMILLDFTKRTAGCAGPSDCGARRLGPGLSCCSVLVLHASVCCDHLEVATP